MSTRGSPPKTVNKSPPGSLFGSQQPRHDNADSPDNRSRHATHKDSQFGKHTNQYHLPQGYSYPPSQQSFPGAPQFYQQSPLNVTHSSQPTSSASQQYPSYGTLWQGYNLHQGGYGGSEMFPPPQLPGHGPSSPGAPRVLPGLPGNHQLNQPTSSILTPPPQPLSGAPGRHHISLLSKRFQPPPEPLQTDFAEIVDLTPLAEMFQDEYDAADECDNSSDLGGAEGKPPISPKQTEFSLEQSAKRMGQANHSEFIKRKKVWVLGFLKKKHRSIIQGQNPFKQVRDGPLHWETAVAVSLATFEHLLPLVNLHNAGWIHRQWVEMFLKKCSSEIQEAMKRGWRGNK